MDNQHLRRLNLKNFRSHEKLELDFNSNFIFFSGPNGIGKTNILEAISLCSPGRGLRFANIDELRLISGSGNWHISALFEVEREFLELEIGIENNGKKSVRVDGKKQPLNNVASILKIIWLTPVMDRLWMGSSNERRRFLDRIVMNFFPDHPRDCIYYDRALRQRNLLFKDNQKDDAWFLAIERQMAEIGYRVDLNRRKIIVKLLETQKENIEPGFFPFLEANLTPLPFSNSEEFLEELVKNRITDRNSGRTSIGPHKSDLIVKHSAKNIDAKYCSTGEQKSLLLALFIANALAISKQFNKSPIILLDEILAHLDQENLENLFNKLKQVKSQIFATGTEKESFRNWSLDFKSFDLKSTDEGIKCFVT
ncbi:MAG: DNA replication/repair protein RecF [Rhodobacteraceae bacterium]|nr:DNA replication/repair protein RecF [Paracoccaceae bacterium]